MNHQFTLSDIEFIQAHFKKVKEMIIDFRREKDENKELESLGGNITLIDWSQFCQSMLLDDIKSLYLDSQNSLI